MFFHQIKSLFRYALFYVSSHISPYLVNPDKDFTRRASSGDDHFLPRLPGGFQPRK